MADNTTIASQTGGDTIATDDIGGVKYQRVKINHGADGSSTDVSAASPLPVAGNIADNEADSGNPLKVAGKYNATAPLYADGDRGDLQLDVSGNVKVSLATLSGGEDLTNNTQATTPKAIAASTYSPSLYTEITQVTKANVKASAGNVISFYITNDNASVRYFQLHNKASAPAGAEVPIYSFKVPAGTANNPGVLEIGTEFFTQGGRYFATGIGWAISTTYGTFTDSGTNTEHIAIIHYI